MSEIYGLFVMKKLFQPVNYLELKVVSVDRTDRYENYSYMVKFVPADWSYKWLNLTSNEEIWAMKYEKARKVTLV